MTCVAWNTIVRRATSVPRTKIIAKLPRFIAAAETRARIANVNLAPDVTAREQRRTRCPAILIVKGAVRAWPLGVTLFRECGLGPGRRLARSNRVGKVLIRQRFAAASAALLVIVVAF